MAFADVYLEKQRNFQVKILAKPFYDLKYIVVIPCFNEFNLIKTLESLRNCDKIKPSIEVLIVINSPEGCIKEILDQNIKTFNEAKSWIHENEDSSFRFFIFHEKDLPKKFAGAGLARKIGMDQAIARFNQLNRDDGVIVSMDADSKVKSNYFTEVEKHFTRYPKTNVITTYFEHPVSGNEFNEDIYNAATIYELYMRYYKLSMDYTGFPYSYYTVGSCFAVRSGTYVKQGGMNRKQAGEDFYFLHKIFPLGNSYEINTTGVMPSSRISDRVPFGTGPMIKSIIDSNSKKFLTYDFNAFLELKIFFSKVRELFKIEKSELEKIIKELPNCISKFLVDNKLVEVLNEINKNSSNTETFSKRFYSWFDAFKVLKYLNFAHETGDTKQPLLEEAEKLLINKTKVKPMHKNYKEYLEVYRSLERMF